MSQEHRDTAPWRAMRAMVCVGATIAGMVCGLPALAQDGIGAPPPGFASAYDDGRLDPGQRIGSAAGAAQMARIWSDEVPARALPGTDVDRNVRSGPPPGFERAFDDGRLSPFRARGTASGQARMDRIWTDTVPRRER